MFFNFYFEFISLRHYLFLLRHYNLFTLADGCWAISSLAVSIAPRIGHVSNNRFAFSITTTVSTAIGWAGSSCWAICYWRAFCGWDWSRGVGFRWCVASKLLSNSGDEWVFSLVTVTSIEIVEVQTPEHGSG